MKFGPVPIDEAEGAVLAHAIAWGGGPKRNVLYICGTTSLYSVWLMVNGAKVV